MTYQPLASELERARCPLCDGADQVPVHDFSPYYVVRCASCQTQYLSPRLIDSAMRHVYEDDSYFQDGEIGYKSYLGQERSLRYSFRQFLQALETRGLTGGSLLEVGCGYGFFLDEAANFFQYRAGIDFSDAVVASARQRANQVYRGDIDTIPATDTYDCIVLVSVIEHVYTPVDFIRTLRGHLRPSGKVIIATPDVNGIYRRLLGRRWPGFQVIPEHVAFYDKRTLSSLMKTAGLSRVTTLPYMRAYPANLVVEEFNVWPILLKRLGERSVVFPGYMVAMCGMSD